ncbi:MAG: hypothetical protein CM1200mP2_22300 [Planctomycetaceae bacterium]|nr:MAG: hypothetical protein CM1200mP2_22300 [Planctomycetaceae bacterium]
MWPVTSSSQSSPEPGSLETPIPNTPPTKGCSPCSSESSPWPCSQRCCRNRSPGHPEHRGPRRRGFVALKSLKKDFFVAVGDAKSWKVNGDVIECNGKPNGYICTKKSYSN